jgi:4'-phosphopantetheinyl transferase
VTTARVDLWLMQPARLSPAELERGDRLLTDEERERQRAFFFERNRLEYLVTRGLIRTVLSKYRAIPAAGWRFRRNEYGRPEVDPPCGLRFNLANHPSLVVCAVHEGEAQLGVDVEPLDRGKEVLDIATTVFAEAELSALRALPSASQPDRAVSLWTLKEAYIKARGMGLALPLKDFAFDFTGTSPRITFSPGLDDDPGRWRFLITDHEHHRIALAVESNGGAQPGLHLTKLEEFADPLPTRTL